MKKKSQEIVNQVKKIRTKNNKCWMELLKLALVYAPGKSKIQIPNLCNFGVNIC